MAAMNAIVTGAGSGIGRATAQRLARDGWTVAVADINLEAANGTVGLIGKNAVAVHVDVSLNQSVLDMVKTVQQQLDSVDLLVNNAGWDRIGPFTESDEALWDKLLAINLKGP